MDEGGEFYSQWAHILWQRRGLRMEEFFRMSDTCRLVYIASEILSSKDPQNTADIMAHSLSKIKFRKR